MSKRFRENPIVSTIHITRLQEGVVVIQFDDFSRSVVEQWAAFIKASDGKLSSPHRVLYDFRKAGPPSPYALQRVGPVMQSIHIPDDTKSAHLYKSALDTQFTKSIIRMMPNYVGKVRAFDDYQRALQWLRD